jgi:class 3 adenylate cyclase/tetratricopeptide (TPR) repeat protein
MPPEIAQWLSGLGLEQYAARFAENDIDARSLPLLTGEDLKELGVSLGHRRLMLAAIATLGTEAPPAPEAPAPPEKRAEGAERRHLTVLFVDLAHSTELTNRLDPEDMSALLQRYQDTVAGAVSSYGGYVAKYLGDGLLVFFGWPRAFEDHQVRAIKAGLEAVRRVQALQAPDGAALSSRVGIATGDVVVGDRVGPNSYEEGAMTGPSVNLAARLQAAAPPDSVVLCAEDCAETIANQFTLVPLERLALKGFSRPRSLLRVAAERAVESRFRAAHGAEPGQGLIGRDLEMELLRKAWRQARAGQGEVVLISGEPGIGKSRLTEGFLAEIAGEASELLRLNCVPYLSSSPFHPVAERITQDAGVAPHFSDAEIVESLARLLDSRPGIDPARVLPVYAALLAPESEAAREVSSLPPEDQRDLTIRTLVEVLKARSARQPVLLLIEDAHWIDPSTQALLSRIGSLCRDLPLLLLVTHRPEWRPDWTQGAAHIHALQLRRLDGRQVSSLIEGITGKAPEARLVGDIMERTDGVPLFVEEITRAMVSGPEQGRVPVSLRGALMARLDAVSEETKEVALAASVIGREFERGLLAASLGQGEAEIGPALEELRRAGLIFESGHRPDHHVFRHALIRDTAYQSLLKETRRQRHARVAEALIERRGAEVERRPELVARHLTEAGDHAAAFARWAAAAEKALNRSASQEAVVNAEACLAAAREIEAADGLRIVEARILVGRSYESNGRLPESLAILREAIAGARALGDRALTADAAIHFTESSMLAGEGYREAAQLCEAALEALPKADEGRACTLYSQLARAYTNLGDFALSREMSRKALVLAEASGDLKAQFAVMMARFAAPFIARGAEEKNLWKANLDHMRQVASQLGTLDKGRDRTLHLFVAAEMADRARMEHSFKLLAEVAGKDRHPHLYWVHTHARAMLAILDGDFALAERCAQEAVGIGRQTHGKHVEGVFGVQMFTLRREQGRLQEVAAVMKRLMEEDEGTATWKPGFALIAAELGYQEAATRLLDELAEGGFALSPDAIYSTILGYLSDICTALEHDRHAETLFALLQPYEDLTITAGATTVCAGAAARRLGDLAALMGDWERAEALFEKALAVDAAMRAPPWIAHDKASFGAALRRRGRRDDLVRATALETEALAIAQKLGMIALKAKLEGRPQ